MAAQANGYYRRVSCQRDHQPSIPCDTQPPRYRPRPNTVWVSRLCRRAALGVARERAAMLATVGTFLVEGLLAHPHSESQREAILQWFTESALPA